MGKLMKIKNQALIMRKSKYPIGAIMIGFSKSKSSNRIILILIDGGYRE